MKARALLTALLLVGGGRAMAQEEDECEETAIDFDMGSTNIDLDAQGELNSVAQWAVLETGRYVLVAASDASTQSEARLADVRAGAVVHYLLQQGLSPRVVVAIPPQAVSQSRRHAVDYRSAVIVMSCSGAGP
jgi:outer membrane protein OmpA-like peptidoglycan-associated protein